MNILKSNYLLLLSLLINILFFFILFISIIFKITFIHVIDNLSFHWFYTTFGEPKMNYSNGLFNDYMTLSATYGDKSTFIIITIIISTVAFIKRNFIFSLWNILTVAIGGIVGIGLKYLLHRSRPFDHLITDTGYSFPSGHSLASTLVIFILIFLLINHLKNKTLTIIISSVLIFIWISILFSRLYFHAHFLSDVLGGVTFSLAWLNLSYFLFRKHLY
ncbi:phosphatase PAP2 family protein [Staphylococcus hominis]|uniref:phosphatase PAP2 family protein n=2 Tax=Staphylococcus TaxID=1279 RepID=UPI0008A94C45|nr:phosphatase PAP2 family protein [Staphylococcus sp. HMSC035D11]MDS3866353.1 phosphatase PAP2 family protein [Staphylococcus hominis]OHO47921.1 PA-phosphatase [Staphylococcus sp. HMSC035D11]